MTFNNETVYRQMLFVTMRRQTGNSSLRVTREMLSAVARDQRVQLKVAFIAGISARFSEFTFVLFCYITNHLIGC